MRILRKLLHACAGFVGSVFCVWAVYRLFEGSGWPALIADLFVGAFVSGLFFGVVFGRAGVWASASGALLAASLLSLPVVLVTYGFALVAFPALIAYAATAAVGALVASRSTKRAGVGG